MIRLPAVLLTLSAAAVLIVPASAESGYRLWLRYPAIADSALLARYHGIIGEIVIDDTTLPQTTIDELRRGCASMLGKTVPFTAFPTADRFLIAGTVSSSAIIRECGLTAGASPAGYRIVSALIDGRHATIIASRGATGTLYGIFHFLRLLQTGSRIDSIDISEAPRISNRILNHWDNLDGTVERGYAGRSLWKWDRLPGTVDSRYTDYARACASIGINGSVLNNVNTQKEFLTSGCLNKVKVLADLFRPWGVRVYLSARFSAPRDLGECSSYDPGDQSVQKWWRGKVDEIYRLIPDFGGFLVKAGSEGQPGPGSYGKNDADGANCLARAFEGHPGTVLWRAFVYDEDIDPDRLKRAYKTFVPLDGSFLPNVVIQMKNGPFDFQPREPVHPLLGAMPHTRCGLELQITKEYLGQANHLVFLAPQWKEVLDFDTHIAPKASDIASIVDGTFGADSISYIAGVANTGSDSNWCGHHFDQANWYAFGRLAWNHRLSPETIALEWVRMTWSNDSSVAKPLAAMMCRSREAIVNYRDPLGLCGIFEPENHYGVAPGDNSYGPAHPTWNAVYWHKADTTGLGYDRTSGGSGFVGQYAPYWRERFEAISTTPEELLCWFHHVPWGYRMRSGRTFWEELCVKYGEGVGFARSLENQWTAVRSAIDDERYRAVEKKIAVQAREAAAWRDTCLAYFSRFSRRPVTGCSADRSSRPHMDMGMTPTPQMAPTVVYDLTGRKMPVAQMYGTTRVSAERRVPGIRTASGVYLLQHGLLPVVPVVFTGR